MSTEKTICEKCGKERRSEMQGSFTQWIFDRNSCSCDSPHNSVKIETPATQFCDKCGRPTALPREGSLTQWIFRSVPCSCSETTATEAIVEEVDVDEGEELPLPPKHFPVDRYKPLEELGSGTSGKVYLCIDRLLKKRVAVKTLRTLSTEQFLAFQTEARATSRLKHPAILNLLDFGPTEGGQPYMVLEYFESQTLTSFIRENGTLDARTVQQIFMPIASALAVSHDMGIFHRDLKPQNILISSSGNQFEVKLIDFGTATVTAFTEAGQSTQSTSLVGTPAYMSPDCASGLPFDARSDIYSLGCVMYECLSGRPPFEGSTPVELLSQHAQSIPPSLLDFDSECPDAVANMVARCLEKNRESRFQSMQELAEALAGLDLRVKKSVDEPVLRIASISTDQTRGNGKARKLLYVVAALSVLMISLAALGTALFPKEEETAPVAPMLMVTEKHWRCKTPEFPERFGDANLKLLVGKKIKRLELTNTQITAKGLRYISNEPLECLRLGGTTPIDFNEALPVVAKMKTLQSLHIIDSQLTNEDLPLLKGLSLKSINLENDRSINNDSIAILAGLFPHLKSLCIARTSVTKEGVCQLPFFKNLSGLNLSQLEIDDSCMECLLNLPKLKTLEIHMSPITNKGFLTLAKNPSITTIKVLGTLNVNNDGLEQMKKLRPDIRIVIDRPAEDLKRPASIQSYAEDGHHKTSGTSSNHAETAFFASSFLFFFFSMRER